MIYEIIDTRTGKRAKAHKLVQEPWAEKTRGCDWPALAVDETGDVMLADDCGNYDMVPEGTVEVRLVVDREKWKPCEYCGGDVDDRPFLNSEDLYISGGGEMCSDSYDVTLFKMSFCPKCGYPLTNAAWAELEKKIRGCVE